METLVCVKRVPATGARMVLTEDARALETRNLGFTVSPHEECAVEEAIQIGEKFGGTSTVLTLGPTEATEQLRDALAMGIDKAILLEIDEGDWDPIATAKAIVSAIKAQNEEGQTFDVLLFGNESADSGGYQVGIRVAHALDLPCVTGVKGLEFEDGRAIARREAGGGWEIFEVPLPAVFTIKEGINLPRYPSLPGKLKAKKKPIENVQPEHKAGGPELIRLKVPPAQASQVNLLGHGPEAAPKIVELLTELRVI